MHGFTNRTDAQKPDHLYGLDLPEMNLRDILAEKKPEIISRWADSVIETYPADTANFLKSQKDRFANPVGHAVAAGLSGIFDVLLSGNGEAGPFLDDIIRVRAVQDFSPSGAVSFVFGLKEILRKTVSEAEASGPYDMGELAAIESSIDEMALKAFDIFVACRERLYEVKANELRRMTFRLIERANEILQKDGAPASEK